MVEKTKINRVLFVIDRSGSMQGILPNAIGALNANIKALRDEMNSKGQSGTVSLVSFSDDVQTHFFNRPINEMPEIERGFIRAGGYTALFDAVGDGITQLEKLPAGTDEDVSYLVIAITDGQENKSKLSIDSLKSMMQRVQATDIWTLTFLVPRGEAKYLTSNFRIPEGNVMEWDATEAGVKRYESQVSKGLATYVSARSTGQRSMKSFFVDLSNVLTKDIKELDDLSNKVTVLSVDSDENIKTFIERKVGRFEKGTAFYQLVGGKERADEVQDYKKILIMEKGKSQVYGGDDVRTVLGLPDTTTKIRPGDLDRFDLFIQSTSTNRKLSRGTRVIHMPSARK